MKSKLTAAVFVALVTTFGIGTSVLAQQVDVVERTKYENVLQGLIDFDSISAAPYPGTPYRARLPFSGAVFDTYFLGQIPIIRKFGHMHHSTTFGMPTAPIVEANGDRFLKVAYIDPDLKNAALFSRTRVVLQEHYRSAVGFGSLAIKFTNRQYVFGFELVAPMPTTGKPKVVVHFYTIEGKRIEPSQTLREFGQYTFLMSDLRREVAGVALINEGPVPFGIDTVVFQLPLPMG